MITANSLSNTSVTTYLMRKKSSYLLIWGWFDWIFYKLHTALSLYSYWYSSAIVIVKKTKRVGFYLIDPEGSIQCQFLIFVATELHITDPFCCQTLRWLICVYLYLLLMFWYDIKNITHLILLIKSTHFLKAKMSIWFVWCTIDTKLCFWCVRYVLLFLKIYQVFLFQIESLLR